MSPLELMAIAKMLLTAGSLCYVAYWIGQWFRAKRDEIVQNEARLDARHAQFLRLQEEFARKAGHMVSGIAIAVDRQNDEEDEPWKP